MHFHFRSCFDIFFFPSWQGQCLKRDLIFFCRPLGHPSSWLGVSAMGGTARGLGLPCAKAALHRVLRGRVWLSIKQGCTKTNQALRLQRHAYSAWHNPQSSGGRGQHCRAQSTAPCRGTRWPHRGDTGTSDSQHWPVSPLPLAQVPPGRTCNGRSRAAPQPLGATRHHCRCYACGRWPNASCRVSFLLKVGLLCSFSLFEVSSLLAVR